MGSYKEHKGIDQSELKMYDRLLWDITVDGHVKTFITKIEYVKHAIKQLIMYSVQTKQTQTSDTVGIPTEVPPNMF